MKIKREAIVRLLPLLIAITYGIILTFLLVNISNFTGSLTRLFALLKPFFLAIGIAFVLNQLLKRIECILIKRVGNIKHIRTISLTLTVLFSIIILFLLSVIIIPQLLDSLYTLFTNLQGYVTDIIEYINDVIKENDFLRDYIEPISLSFFSSAEWQDFVREMTNLVANNLTGLFNNTIGIASELATWFMGFMLSLYLLSSKETFIRQFKKIIVAALPKDITLKMMEIFSEANKIYSGFISGQLTEALILSVLYYVCMTLLNMPYALLISTVIGVFSIVPMFGAILGMIFGAVLLFAIDPIQSLWFIIFFQLLQQFEGNVIYPRVVGNSVGLPGIWVLLSIVVFGGLFGIFGMLISVPTTALLYSLTRQFTHYVLDKRGIVVDDNEIIYLEEQDEIVIK